MATVVEVQEELDPGETVRLIRILKLFIQTTKSFYYCTGGVGLAGRAKWCETTTADSAATQAAAITTAMESVD